MTTLWRDVIGGIRILRKQPGFTAVAVLTLALGIGANSAIFSVVEAVLLRSTGYRDASRLVMIWETLPDAGIMQNTPAPLNFLFWKQHSLAFDETAAWSTTTFNLTGNGDPEQLRAMRVSGNLFPMLGVQPELGRSFLTDEDRARAEQVAMISHRLWQRRFGSDRALIGRAITLNGRPVVVAGVMPAWFQFPLQNQIFESDIWVPLAFSAEEASSLSRSLWVIGRMKDGVAAAQAQSELERVIAAQQKQGGHGINVVPLNDQLVGSVRPALLIVLAASGFVLLIACANVANLLLARGNSRRKETAVRVALGAGRWRLMLQFLAEGAVLAAFAGMLGLLTGIWLVDVLGAVMPQNLAAARNVSLNLPVLGFTAAISLLTGIACGFAPAIQAFRPQVSESLKEGGRNTASRKSSRAGSALVVAEIAIAVLLLAGSGLMLSSFIQLHRVDMGFNADGLLSAAVTVPPARYPERERRVAFFSELLANLESLPGVESAAVINGLPINFRGGGTSFMVEGRSGLGSSTPLTTYRIISPAYFETMNIRLAAGRPFTAADTAASEPVIIVSESLASAVWPGESAIGRHLRWGADGDWMTVVGVAGDIRLSVTAGIQPHAYMPYTQAPVDPYEVVLRTAVPPATLADAVRREVWRLDRDLAIANIRTMEDIVSNSLGRHRFNMIVLVTLGAIAVVLAMVGVYGVMSYAVAQTTREIGIRMALGARSLDVLRMILMQGLKFISIGVAIGIAGALGLTRLMTSLLFGVAPRDPMIFIAASLLVALVALLACYIPARRTTSVDPVIALRLD